MTQLDRFMIHPVVLVAPSWTTNRYGDRVPLWDDMTTEIPERGWWAVTSTTEQTDDGREAIVSDVTLTLPAGSAIERDMRVRRGERTYEVIGEVEPAETPTGTHHLVVHLREVIG